MIVFDTYALVKLLKKEAGFEQIAKRLKAGGYISAVNTYELLYVITRDFIDKGHDLDESIRKALEILNSINAYLKEHPLTVDIMLNSIYFKNNYRKLNLSHFDCIALSTAKELNLPLLSGDKGLLQVKEIKVIPE